MRMGMNRRPHTPVRRPRSAPHACGDEPGWPPIDKYLKVCSPLVWDEPDVRRFHTATPMCFPRVWG